MPTHQKQLIHYTSRRMRFVAREPRDQNLQNLRNQKYTSILMSTKRTFRLTAQFTPQQRKRASPVPPLRAMAPRVPAWSKITSVGGVLVSELSSIGEKRMKKKSPRALLLLHQDNLPCSVAAVSGHQTILVSLTFWDGFTESFFTW